MSLKLRLRTLGLVAGLLAAAPIWAQNSFTIGCPATVKAGSAVQCTVTLTLAATVNVDSLDYTIEVNGSSGAPTPTNIGFTDGLTAYDGNPLVSSYSAHLNGTAITAEWVTLSPAIQGAISQTTATFSFTIPSGATASNTYSVSFGAPPGAACCGDSPSNVTTTASGAQTINITPVLAITNPTSGATLTPAATAGQPYSLAITTSGGTTPISYSLSGWPAGFNISGTAGTGTITGTFAAATSFANTLGVTAKDSSNPQEVANATYSLTVNPAITAVGPALPNGTVGAAYASGNISPTGGTPPYTFTTTANLASYNLTLSPVAPATGAAATITGTPNSGVTNLSIPLKVTDANGATFTGNLTLTITGIAITAPGAGALPNATVGLVYDGTGVSITSSGGTGTISWSLAAGSLPLPAGLSLGSTGANSATGTITGTPTGSPGLSTFTVQAKDANGVTATRQYTITVYAAPSLGAGSLPIATVGSAYNTAGTNPFSLTGGAPPVVWSVTGLPSGLGINANTGAITGTPGSGTNGAYNPTIKVTDANGATTSTSPSLTVDPALSITTATPLPAATLNGPYTVTLAGSGGSSTGYSWSAQNLPAGLSITGGNTITGTVTGGSANNVMITLTDSTGASVNKTFSITVNPALSITTASPLPAATVSTAYPFTFAASGGTGTLTWTQQNLPGGLSLSSAGAISGSPSATGTTANIMITVTDVNTASITKTFSLTVNALPVVGGPGTLPTATVGSTYTTGNNITLTGGTAPIAWTISGLPNGMGLSINSSGVISGTPTTNAASPYTVTVKATDANGAFSSQNFTLPVDPALTLTPATLPVAIPGVAYSQKLTPGGGSLAGYTLNVAGLPSGLSFSNGTISGTPAAAAAANSPYKVVATLSDSTTASATFNYTLAVAPPLSITTVTPAPAGTVKVPYVGFTIAATGGTPPYNWSATNLPPGLSISTFNGNGVIRGTPTALAGSPYSVNVTVTDANGTTASMTYSIAISALPLQITTGLLPPGVVNSPYPFTSITAQGGIGNYTWSITGLPPGLTTDGNGDISGTPTTATGSPFSVVASVTDATLNTFSRTFSLAISNVLTVVGPAALPAATLNAAYTPTTVTAGGGLPPYTWTATGLPAGLSIGIATGTVSGTPTSASGSPYSVTVTVTDSTGKTAAMNYSLTVGTGVTITGPASLPVATLGAAYPSTTITAAGGSGVYTWSATGLPAGLSIGATTGAITGTPTGTTSGTATVVVTVTDTTSNTASKTYSLIVNQPAGSPVIATVSTAAGGQMFIAPNMWVSIYGTGFTTPGFTDTWTNAIKNSATGALPTVLDNVTVTVGGLPAYVYYISATQINVLTPNIGFGPLAVMVTNGTGSSNVMMSTSQGQDPAFFEWPNSSGQTPGDTSQQPVATHSDYTYAAANGTFGTTPSVPAKPGETIVLWGAGFGATTPANPFGVAIPSTGGPFVTTQNVVVLLNNAPITVINNNAILTPGDAGLYQMAVTIPSTLPNGTYSISVSVNGVVSPTLSLAVHN